MSDNTASMWQQRWDAVMARNYGTPPLTLVSGSGCHVRDADGRDYLDLLAGIAVNALGHAHPAVVAAVSEQVARIAHTSNLYVNERAVELAERLVGILGVAGTRVFLCNDGTTANEAAIKTVLRARPGRRRFVAAENSFHGRSLGALALTGKEAARAPFAPFGIEVVHVAYGDADALANAVDDHTAAVVLEPTLGEAGVVPPPDGYLQAARDACDAAGALLVIDEIQSGIGRTGAWFAHQREGIVADIVTLAKGLGGGLPIGACLATGDTAEALQKGDHGSTFGGNPVACAAALAVIDTIEKDGLLDHVTTLGERWSAQLARTIGVRGRGLWLALVVTDGSAPAIEVAARDAGFLVNATGPDAVRLAPPLVLTEAEATAFADALPSILDAAAGAVSVGGVNADASAGGTRP
ncbi:MAG: acetylornithine/N-succinyldiaminopimelate aminotransferase [Frankiaceae bacterium]|jgi:acetylornithine aminotransferase|nr:acetylornithine/N-succinyldiaminopimelate aminotransferase [Frankiaceae bacterium]